MILGPTKADLYVMLRVSVRLFSVLWGVVREVIGTACVEGGIGWAPQSLEIGWVRGVAVVECDCSSGGYAGTGIDGGGIREGGVWNGHFVDAVRCPALGQFVSCASGQVDYFAASEAFVETGVEGQGEAISVANGRGSFGKNTALGVGYRAGVRAAEEDSRGEAAGGSAVVDEIEDALRASRLVFMRRLMMPRRAMPPTGPRTRLQVTAPVKW